MEKTILFMIHGMGIHAEGWEAPLKAKIEEVASRYDNLKDVALWDHIKLIPLSYDKHLTNALDQWQTAAGSVSAFAEANKIDGAENLSWLDDVANEDSNFFWSHIADVVAYRFLKLARERIRASIVEQITTPLMAIPAPRRDFDRVVLVAHSLGTSVLHDSLHLLGTGRFADFANAFSPPTARFRAIFTLANVSRVLQQDIKAYESIVQPGPRNKIHSNCSLFYDYRHDLDPICVVRRFEPEHFAPRHYIHRTLTHYRDWNVHGFEHYLDNPRVHIHLLNLLFGRPVVSRSQYLNAVDNTNYPQFGGRFRDVPELQCKVQELLAIRGEVNEDSELAALIKTIMRTQRKLSEIREIIAGFNH